MAFSLKEIIPWGRTYEEYELMFALRDADLADGVLDCGGGPAAFTAGATQRGFHAVSVDPVYAFSAAQIRERFETVEEELLAQVRASPGDWVWSYHRDLDDLRRNRRNALAGFLADFEADTPRRRYRVAELPELPFDSGAFGLALCSHLLFLYSDLLSEDFHVRAALELCRVAREVRIFPLQTLGRVRSPHLPAVIAAVEQAGFKAQVCQVNYEFVRGSNQMLRLFRAA